LKGRLQGPAMATAMLEGRDRQGAGRLADGRRKNQQRSNMPWGRPAAADSRELDGVRDLDEGRPGPKKGLGKHARGHGGMGIQGSEVTPSPTQLQVALLCP
jgi:hypothetical protein